jgi:hypothetical protein
VASAVSLAQILPGYGTDSLIPASASKATGFVPKGWQIDSVAEGDLNRDGRKDCALVLSNQDASDRRLIIALAQGDGLLHKSDESQKAVALQCGPSAGIPQVEIRNNILHVEHYCGSRWRDETEHKYQLRNGQWCLIGYTDAGYDSLSPVHANQKIDVNFLTGEVEASLSDGKKGNHERFFEVRSPLIESAEVELTDWTAPAVWLKSSSRGCPIVSIQSVHNSNNLFLRTQLQGSDDLSDKEIQLFDSKGQLIPPSSEKKTQYGYVLSEYDMRGPQLSTEAARAKESPAESLLRLTVSITPTSSGCQKKFATSIKGAGGIFLTTVAGPPRLADVDVRDGDQAHPFLWPTPED